MYAVIATGGKQYRVEKGSVLRVEKLAAEPGSAVKFDQVLLGGAAVHATVERHGQGAKKSIVKFRRRKHYLRMGNHRQQFTEIKITDISAG